MGLRNATEPENEVNSGTSQVEDRETLSGLFKTADSRTTPSSNVNLCIFTALAKLREKSNGTKKFTQKSKDLFCLWFEEIYPDKKVHCNKFITYNKNFQGLTPKQLPSFEKFFDVRVELYRKVIVQTAKGRNKKQS